MDIERYTSPFDCDEVINLWSDIFGEYEAELEKIQCDGTEEEVNTDIVYLAKENGKLLGVVHTTISKTEPLLAGMSGVCTTPEARGKGISRILFEKAMEEIDSLGVKATFLGTGHPLAIKVYESCGFSFIPCTGAMARVPGSNFGLFCCDYYSKEHKNIKIVPGNAAMRLPLVPFVLGLSGDCFIDINACIMSRGINFSQVSCMGLYQKFLDVEKAGGSFLGAFDENGILGATASAMPTDKGIRADFRVRPGFESAAKDFVSDLEDKYGRVYLQIADADESKIKIAESLGFKKREEILHSYRDICLIPMHIFEK